MDTRMVLKRVRFTLAIIFIVLLGLFGAYVTIAQPEVKVTAPANTMLSISTPEGKLIDKKESVTEATFRMWPGSYIVRAENADSQALAYIDAGLFSSQTVDLELDQPLGVEPLALAVAAQPQLQAGSMFYYNPTIKQLEQFSNDGTSSTVDDEEEDQDEDGADSEHGGVYKTLAVSGNKMVLQNYERLLVLDNGVLRNLNTNGIEQAISADSVILGGSSLQESFVVAIDKALYLYKNTTAAPEKIMDLPKKINQLAFGGSKVIAFSDELAFSREDVRSAYVDFAIQPLVIDINNKSTRELSGPLVEATVSLDGKRATLQDRHNAKLTIYDLEQNRILYTTEKPSLAAPLWVSGDEYVYERDKVVWRANTSQKTANNLGKLLQHANSIIADGQNFMVTTFMQDASEPRGMVYRLTDKPLNPMLSIASQLTPISGPNYQIVFANIDQPRLIIETTASVNDPDDVAAYRAKLEQLRRDALADIQAKGIDINAFTITFVPAD